MVFVDPPEPSKEQILILRETVLKKIESDGLMDKIDSRDIKRFQTDDSYLRRFLMHHDNDQKLASDMAIDTFKWRKEIGVNDITEDTLDKEMVEKNSLFIHNRDKDGCKMLIFIVRNHNKDAVDIEKLKTFLIYWVERLEREEKGKFITVVFDMKDTGLRNMDMVFVQYFINLFKFYYPWILNYILVFEMPWILNAMWKIIKGWLPPKSVDKIKFVDKKSVITYVTQDQLLPEWGGTIPFTFKFEPEKREAKKVQALMNGDVEGKKVHFAEEGSSSFKEATLTGQNSILEFTKFQIEPSEELIFTNNRIGTSAIIMFTNNSPNRFAFKIKTTSPDKYRVRPCIGTVDAKDKMEVTVTLSDQLAPSLLVRDKFLVIAIPTSQENMSQQEFADLVKNTSKLDMFEIRLRVGLVNSDVTDGPSNSIAATPVSPVITTKLDQLMTHQAVMEEQFKSLRRLMYVIFVLLIGVLFAMILTVNNMTSLVMDGKKLSSSIEL
ncbi:Motile sperm domain-containing protein 2 [Armadillidium nasatum]|uniref:Motile sperm domain-containing protein 2 n=1 Tax=Armadillidium nasatum TaxID=96803 RepID=A0A5N5SZL7_9CRUS|nr:Motile sperm domain-containing protein 2 [Armadillidium nasatum]